MRKDKLLRPLLFLLFAASLLGWVIFVQLPRDPVGDVQYGGVLRISIKGEAPQLNPLVENTITHHRIQQLVFEPLIKMSDNGQTWHHYLSKNIVLKNNGASVYIELKRNIRFAPNPCFKFTTDELHASDVAFSLSLACSNHPKVLKNPYLANLIVGGKEYFSKKISPLNENVSGIQVLDNYRLKISLTDNYNHFLKMLSGPSFGIMSKAAAIFYGDDFFNSPVGTGAFQLESNSNQRALFVSNPNYWRKDKFGNKLPYLKKVVVSYNVSGKKANSLFLQNQLDLLFDLPVDDLQNAFGTLKDAKSGRNPLHEIYLKEAAKVHFIQFNCTRPPFDNPNLRRAFALAIDTRAICDEVLRGDGSPLFKNFIPSSKKEMEGPNASKDTTMEARIKEAKNLLLLAGYDETKPLPSITFFIDATKESIAYRWAKAIKEMLTQNLGVSIVLSEKTHNNNQNFAIWRNGWIGDYWGAESYLRLFYSPAQQPLFFKNKNVDELYKTSILARGAKQKQAAENLCEKEILKQQALIPIYSEGFVVVNQLRLRGLKLNESGLLDYATLFIKNIAPN